MGVERMAQYKLHCIGASGNAYKVALYLNCAGLDWQPVGVDFAGGQTRDANWRAKTNAMGEVPVLEVDGQRMSQSGAILMWLAETTGKFAPADNQRFEALRWLFFDNHKFTANYAMHRFQSSFTPEPVHQAVLAFLRSRVEASHSIADKHLRIGHSCWAKSRPSWTSPWRDTCTIRPRRQASILSRLPGHPCLASAAGCSAGLEASVRTDAGGFSRQCG